MRLRTLLSALALIGAWSCARYAWVNELDVPGACPGRAYPPGAFAFDSAGVLPPAGRMAGAVERDSVGGPVEAAQVVLRATADTTHVGALTDAAGRFRLGPVPPGRYVLHVLRLGYARRADTLRLGSDAGARVRVRLAAQMLDGPCSGFTVVRVRKHWWHP